MTERTDRVGRAIELFMFAPLGIGSYLRETAPSIVNELVARGRAEVDRRQQELSQRITTVRSQGEVAVAFGVPMVRERVQQRVEGARTRANQFIEARRGNTSTPAPAAVLTRHPTVVPMATTPVAEDSPSSGELPIPGYDSLSASQVVERLGGLAPTELDLVHAYENAHRQRRTILGKIEQLTG
ncbi:MAG TPA: hypothetical protein VFR41_15085 [Acidimicrobiia bacterium]|nr:hypothetical protein [Acidimicrobiia bacterium]